MADTLIYYFSGTGNSLAVARDLAGPLDADLIPMADRTAVGSSVESMNAETAIGLVFPLYDFKAPGIVSETLDLLDLGNRYLFALATFGVSPGRGLPKLATEIASRGGRLSFGAAVAMPHNAVGSARLNPDNDDGFFDSWKRRQRDVARSLGQREESAPDSESLLKAFLRPRLLRQIPVILNLLGLLVFRGPQSLAFISGRACTGCGTCRRVCPGENISLPQGRPLWGDRCLSCFACLQWCPEHAVSFSGRTLYTRRYRHPGVTTADMILRD